jgi:hypothetical protein
VKIKKVTLKSGQANAGRYYVVKAQHVVKASA